MSRENSVKLKGLGEKGLARLSSGMLLSLDTHEMKAIQEHYLEKGREPTRIELETIAQTWSEHCKHKTFSAEIIYTQGTEKKNISGLFRTFIREPSLATNKEWIVSAFSDNAGIIRFNENYNVAIKAETHNHPSALDPYGGANTGLGGVIRDVVGAGLGARPFANTDVFCFAPPETLEEKVPKGVLHPKRIFKGVRSGVADYGNRMGIPTVNGAIVFDDRYMGNPLVYCGTAGLIPRGMETKNPSPGQAIVVVGGRTGRDGIHGATFSSTGLDKDSEHSAVQIGNAIEEKKMVDAVLKARDMRLYTAITDCGAGGFSSAIGEMAASTGAVVWLEKAPLKYKGLEPWEVWLSEAQERMVIAVPKENLARLEETCRVEGTEATVIGEFTSTGKLELLYNQEMVGELEMEFLHKGLPAKKMPAEWKSFPEEETSFAEPEELGETLRALLAMPSIASKESTVRKYDHEVRGGTVGKPFVGKENDGPADAAIVRPILDDWRGIVLSNGINPLYSDKDPYWMACSVIDEAIRNAICVGAEFEKTALLDNFSWASPEDKKQLGGLVRACMACKDACEKLGTPFISGKDSLYNEHKHGKKTIAVPGTLLITAVSIILDSRKKVSMPLKEQGNPLYIIGETRPELGGSHYAKLCGTSKGKVPKTDFKKARETFSKLSRLLATQEPENKAVMACHDCSEGGLAVAIAEMAFASGLGAGIDLGKVPLGEKTMRGDFILFSESNTRFIVEVKAGMEREFEEAMRGTALAQIGAVNNGKKLVVKGTNGKIIVEETLEGLKEAWKRTLDW